MTTWLGEITCPDCGHWQIPMSYCPKCGHKWRFVGMPPEGWIVYNTDYVTIGLDDIQWSYTGHVMERMGQ